MFAWLSRRLAKWKSRAWFGKARTVVGLTIILVVVVFFSVTLTRSWSQISPYLRQMDFVDVLIGQLLTLMAFLLGGIAWFFVQMAFGIDTTWQHGMAVHILSNATKYVPGFGWQYLSKGYLIKNDDVTTGQVSLAIITEVILLLSAGIVIGSFTASFVGEQWNFPWSVPAWGWQAFGIVTLVMTWLFVRFTNHRMQSQGKTVYNSWLAGTWLAAMMGWILYAASCWFFVKAIQEDLSSESLAYCLVALVAAGIASIVVLVVPGGLGVREATLAFLLIGLVPFSLGVVVSIMMRVSVMVSELLGVIAVLIANHRSNLLRTEYPIWIIHRNTPK